MATNKTIVSKDILDALTGVTSNKGNFETGKVWGEDYEQYRTAAQPHYQYLYDNGFGNVADELKNTNYIGAQDILARYGLADSAADKAGDFASGNMSNLKSFLPDTNKTYADYSKGINSNYTDFTDRANNSYKDTQRYLEPYAKNLNDLYGKYSISVDTVNSQNNQLWDDMRQFGTEQTARYDKLSDYVYNNDYTATPWYQTIMEGYNIKGDNAAGDAIASAGGSNSGNIDSYAAANANRQQLAFTNAGNTAALNAYNSQIGNLLGTIQSLGYDIGNLQNRQQANIDSSRNANQGMLDSYNTGNNILGNTQNNAVNNLLNAYGMAGENYNSGYNNLMGAQNTENQILSNAYSDILSKYTDLDANQKNYDINELTSKYKVEEAKATGEAEKIKAEYDYAAKIYGIDANILMNENDNYTKALQYQLQYDLGLTQEQTKEVIQQLVNDGVIQKAVIDSTSAQNVAGINAESSNYKAQLEATAKNYATEMGYLENQENNTSKEKIATDKNTSDQNIAQYETEAKISIEGEKNFINYLNSNSKERAKADEIFSTIDFMYNHSNVTYLGKPMTLSDVEKALYQQYPNDKDMVQILIGMYQRENGIPDKNTPFGSSSGSTEVIYS